MITAVFAFAAFIHTPSPFSEVRDTPNVERWTPRVDGKRVLLSRTGSGSQQAASYISLAEMANSAGGLAVFYKVQSKLLQLTLVHGSGRASIVISSGRVKTASGNLAGMRGRQLLVVRRDGLDGRSFLDSQKRDYLVPIGCLSALLPKSSAKIATELPLYPEGIDLRATYDLNDDGSTITGTSLFLQRAGRSGPVRFTAKAAIRRAESDGKTVYALTYDLEFKNDGQSSAVIQPALLRPVFKGVLQEFGPVGKPLGRSNALGDANIATWLTNTDVSPSSWWLPSRILLPGQTGTYHGVRVPLGSEFRRFGVHLPLTFEYNDGRTPVSLVLEPSPEK